VRILEVLPDELALRQSLDGPLQALRPERGGMRAEVLQPQDVSLLWEGGVLPEQPLVLRDGGQADLLPARPEVRGADPRG
jgi:hypothetical protein